MNSTNVHSSDLIAGIWPTISTFLTRLLEESVTPHLQNTFGKNSRFVRIDLGCPPQLDLVKVYCDARNSFVLLPTLRYGGRDVDVRICISELLTSMKLTWFRIRARFGILIGPILDAPPFVASVQLFLFDRPEVEFEIGGIKGEMTKIPSVERKLYKFAEDFLCRTIVLPNRLFFKFAEAPQSPFSMALGCPQPERVLRLRILRAEQLAPRDQWTSSFHHYHPICSVAVGGDVWRSKEGHPTVNAEKPGFRHGTKKAVRAFAQGASSSVKTVGSVVTGVFSPLRSPTSVSSYSKDPHSQSYDVATSSTLSPSTCGGLDCRWEKQFHDFVVCHTREQQILVDIWDENQFESFRLGNGSICISQLREDSSGNGIEAGIRHHPLLGDRGDQGSCRSFVVSIPLSPSGTLYLEAVWLDLQIPTPTSKDGHPFTHNVPAAAAAGAVVSVVHRTLDSNLAGMVIEAELEGTIKQNRIGTPKTNVAWESQSLFLISNPQNAALRLKYRLPNRTTTQSPTTGSECVEDILIARILALPSAEGVLKSRWFPSLETLVVVRCLQPALVKALSPGPNHGIPRAVACGTGLSSPTDPVELLNDILQHVWPNISAYVEAKVWKMTRSILKRLPPWLKGLRFDRITLGKRAVRITEIRNLVSTPERVNLTLGIEYTGEFQMGLSVPIPGLGLVGSSIKDLTLNGNVGVEFAPIRPQTPIFYALSLWFTSQPDLGFSLEGLARLGEWAGLKPLVGLLIVQKIGTLMAPPHRLSVRFASPNQFSSMEMATLQCPMPKHLLRLRLIEARGLPASDIGYLRADKSDPYCIFTIGSQMWRSSTVWVTGEYKGIGNLASQLKRAFWWALGFGDEPVIDPVLVTSCPTTQPQSQPNQSASMSQPVRVDVRWEDSEMFDFIVSDVTSQRLMMEVWDDDAWKFDDLLGSATSPLQTLVGNSDHWLPLNTMGHVRVQSTLFPLSAVAPPAKTQTNISQGGHRAVAVMAVRVGAITPMLLTQALCDSLDSCPFSVKITVEGDSHSSGLRSVSAVEKGFLFKAKDPMHCKIGIEIINDDDGELVGLASQAMDELTAFQYSATHHESHGSARSPSSTTAVSPTRFWGKKRTAASSPCAQSPSSSSIPSPVMSPTTSSSSPSASSPSPLTWNVSVKLSGSHSDWPLHPNAQMELQVCVHYLWPPNADHQNSQAFF